MQPTTVTNSDGTFSPAILIEQEGHYATWINRKIRTAEDTAVEHAKARIATLQRHLEEDLYLSDYHKEEQS